MLLWLEEAAWQEVRLLLSLLAAIKIVRHPTQLVVQELASIAPQTTQLWAKVRLIMHVHPVECTPPELRTRLDQQNSSIKRPQMCKAQPVSTEVPSNTPDADFTDTARAYPLGGVSGPHQTDTANRLDPHVPGEFPTEVRHL